MRLVVVDYRINNLGSLLRSIEFCGVIPIVARCGNDLAFADKIIVPGVGTFSDGMQKLIEFGFVEPLRHFALVERKPILGICLGMQLFAAKGFEPVECVGLGFFNFFAEKLCPTSEERLPHMGWNSIVKRGHSKLLLHIPEGADFYFVHSYGIKPESAAQNCVAAVNYSGGFTAVVEKDNIFGVQFHPEKSFPFGFQVLKNFLAL